MALSPKGTRKTLIIVYPYPKAGRTPSPINVWWTDRPIGPSPEMLTEASKARQVSESAKENK